MIKRSYPSLLNELIVTSELPSDLLFGVFWWKVVILVHRTVSYILFLHHISCIEIYWKKRRGYIKSIHSLDIHYVYWTFWQLMWQFKYLCVTSKVFRNSRIIVKLPSFNY
jgi:hypothetical protein